MLPDVLSEWPRWGSPSPLAAIGVYGVLAYNVSSRTCEMGLRLAPRRIAASIAGGGHRSCDDAAIGIVLGLAPSLAFVRLLLSWLYGLSPADPVVLRTTTIVMSMVALLAGYLPARRASSVDRIVALRPE